MDQRVRYAESAGENNPYGIMSLYKPMRFNTGVGVPLPTFGEDYWQYMDSDSGILYQKLNGVWTGTINYSTLAVGSSTNYLAQSTGIISGGDLDYGTLPNTFKITAGAGVVLVGNVVTDVSWFEHDNVSPLFTNNQTFVAIDISGAVYLQNAGITRAQRRNLIVIGSVLHSDGVSPIIDAFDNDTNYVSAPYTQLSDLTSSIGAFRISGLITKGMVGTLNLERSFGTLFRLGCNLDVNANDPNVATFVITAPTPIPFGYILQNSELYTNATMTAILPDLYESAPNVISAVPAGKITVQRVFMYSTGNVRITFGQFLYDTINAAIAEAGIESFLLADILTEAVQISYMIVQTGITDLDSALTSKFIASGALGGNSTSGGAASSFDQLLNTTDSVAFVGLTATSITRTPTVNGLLPNGNLAISGSGTGIINVLSDTNFNANDITNVATINGIDISARDLILTSTTTTANGAVQRAGDTMAGQLLAIDGSAAAPSVAFASDVNTGIFSVGVDGFGISAGGITQAVIGVGQTTFDCEFNSTGQVLGKNGTDVSPSYSFTNNSNTGIFLAAGDSLGITTGGVESVRVNNVGNVGIGTSAPTQRLTVSGNINSTGGITAATLINTPTVNGLLPNGNLAISGSGTGIINVLSDTNFNANDIINVSTINGIDISARDLILTSTTTTANGALQRTGGTMTGQILALDGSNTTPGIAFASDVNTGIYSNGVDSLAIAAGGVRQAWVSNGLAVFDCELNATGQILGKDGTAVSPAFSFGNDNLTGLFLPVADSIAITCAGSEYVRVDGFGNVGIGTSAPTQRLTVSGNINATGSMAAGTVITAGSRFDALNVLGLRYTFSSDTDTGINYLAADNFALTTAAVDRLIVSTTGIGMTLPLAMGANTITTTGITTAGTFRTGSGVAGYGFTADANSGMSFVGANKIALTSNGSDKLIVEAALVSTTEDFTAGINDISALTMTSTGTFLAPSTIGARYVFTGDADTGLYYVGNNSFALTTFGTNRLIVSTTAVTLATTLAMGVNNITSTGTISATTITANAVTGTVTGDFAALTCTTVSATNTSTAGAGFRANGGTPTVPSYSYTSDTNTGTYQPAADQLAIVCGGTQTVTFSGTATTLNTGYLQLPASSIAAPAIRLPLTGPGSLVGYIADHGSANTLSIGINNVGLFLINSSEIITGTNVRPGATNTSLCGLSSRRWLNVYGLDITGTNAYTTPSDSRLKHDIHPCEFSLDFINGIEPVCYKWNDPTWYGTNESCGFIAQQVLGVIEGLGYTMDQCDIVGISTPDVDDPDQTAYYNMKTAAIIPALVGSIHELTARIVALEATPVRLTTISEKMTSSDESTTAHVGDYSKSEKSALTIMRKEMKAMKASIVGLRAELDSLNNAEMLRSQREDDNAFEHL